MVSDFDAVVGGIRESREAAGALAKGMVGIAERYTSDRRAFLGFADKVEQRFMKQDHPDFDADEIRSGRKRTTMAGRVLHAGRPRRCGSSRNREGNLRGSARRAWRQLRDTADREGSGCPAPRPALRIAGRMTSGGRTAGGWKIGVGRS
jgi:hypothetical protein